MIKFDCLEVGSEFHPLKRALRAQKFKNCNLQRSKEKKDKCFT